MLGWLRRVRSARGARPCWPPPAAHVGEGRRNREAETSPATGKTGRGQARDRVGVGQPASHTRIDPPAQHTQPDGGTCGGPGLSPARAGGGSQRPRARAGWGDWDGKGGTTTDRRVGPATTLPPSSPDMSHLIPIGQLLLPPAARSLLPPTSPHWPPSCRALPRG
jgi:hypothetical protein